MNRLVRENLLAISLVFFGILFVVFYGIDPQILNPRTRGSFEFVREGERLMDAKRYRDAVAAFEKAHESSPENKTIVGYLVWAYSEYADEFARSDDHDEAIRLLAKAFELQPDRNTGRNLAVACAKKGLALAQQGDLRKAAEYFSSARDVADTTVHSARNLSLFLFFSAVQERNAGRDDNAILCLREALLVEEDPRVLELLGEIFYRKADLENAFFYWGRANAADPTNTFIVERLERLAKERDLAKDEKRKALPHFELRYDASLSIPADQVQAALEQAYLDIGEDFAYFPASKTLVFFYSEEDFGNVFKMSPMVRAFYDGNIRMPFPKRPLGVEELVGYLAHEYTHAVVSAVTSNGCPVWLNEGIAMWEGYGRTTESMKRVVSALGDSFNPSLASLEAAFAPTSGVKDIQPSYLTACTAVGFIVQEWGLKGLRGLLRRIADGQHAVNAIEDEFLVSQGEFEKRWAAYVRQGRFRDTAVPVRCPR